MVQSPLPGHAETSILSRGGARALLVVLASALVCMWHYQLWTAEDWRRPTAYHGDALEVLARLQAASEGDTWPLTRQVIGRLGAPFGAHWNAYPTPDKLLLLGLGGFARWIGLFPAANLGLLAAQGTAALAFYWVARRWLRIRGEWAAAGALLFAYAYAPFHRGLEHFSFVFTWTVPPGLLAAWLVARSRRMTWRRPEAWVCVGAGAALGAHNPYNLYFWLPLMGWALLAQWLGVRRRANLSAGAAGILAALVLFGLMHWEYWFFRDEPEGRPLLARNYGGTERYALKPVECFIPPASHRVELLAFFGQRYDRWSEWRGEGYVPYLGLAGIAGLVWLLAAAVRRLLQNRTPPGQALVVSWLLAFASVGGVNNLLAFFTGLQSFRATNRIIVFISAAVLFFLAGRLTRLSRDWPGWLSRVVALALTVLGLLDQVPRPAGQARRDTIAAAVAEDRRLAGQLEAALPAGAMVFQLPVLGFPESTPPWRMGDYEHFRLYLHSSRVRFSYGAAKFRARSRWQLELEEADPLDLARELEGYGFAALVLDSRGYQDGGDALLRGLAKLGYPRLDAAGRDPLAIVPLRPSAEPVLPLAQRPVFGLGWHRPDDDGVRWAFSDAALSYHNPGREPREFTLRLWLSSPQPQTVALWHEDHERTSFQIGPEARLFQVLGLRLTPGVNRLEMRPGRKAQRQGSGRYQLRSFALHRMEISPSRGRADLLSGRFEREILDREAELAMIALWPHQGEGTKGSDSPEY